MRTYIVLAQVGQGDGREICEHTEGTIFETLTQAKAYFKKEYPETHVGLMDISFFMDACNNQEMDLDDYFIGYTHVKN